MILVKKIQEKHLKEAEQMRYKIRGADLPAWFLKAEGDLEIEIENGLIHVVEGVWKEGIWKNGVWEKGTWKGGTWRDGVWENGTWEKGTWYSGIWENGLWESGVWMSGTWENGTWREGWIHDPRRKGNNKYVVKADPISGCVLTNVSPRVYFGQ